MKGWIKNERIINKIFRRAQSVSNLNGSTEEIKRHGRKKNNKKYY